MVSFAADVGNADYAKAIKAVEGKVTQWVHYFNPRDSALAASSVLHFNRRAGAHALKKEDFDAWVASFNFKDIHAFQVSHSYIDQREAWKVVKGVLKG